MPQPGGRRVRRLPARCVIVAFASSAITALLIVARRRSTTRQCNPQLAQVLASRWSDLLRELLAYPEPKTDPIFQAEPAGIAVPLWIRTDVGLLSFLSTTTVFGTPTDVTLSELAIETFPPAEPATAEALRTLFDRVAAPC